MHPIDESPASAAYFGMRPPAADTFGKPDMYFGAGGSAFPNLDQKKKKKAK